MTTATAQAAPTAAEIIAAIENAPTFEDGPGDYFAKLYPHVRDTFWDRDDFRRSEDDAWEAQMQALYEEFDAIAHEFMRTKLTAATLRFAAEHPEATRRELVTA